MWNLQNLKAVIVKQITAQPEQTCEVMTLACNILQICHPLMTGSWTLAMRVNQSIM